MSDLTKLATQLISNGPHKLEITPRRVRVLFNGKYVADTLSPRHVWEHPFYPAFYIASSDITPGVLTTGKSIDGTDGGASLGQVKVGSKQTDRVLIFNKGPLEGLVRLDFSAMDSWFEEDTPIYVHPKDPYKRVDILPSNRHVRVVIDGVTVAETSTSMHLHETGLPVRYYLPATAVNYALTRPSDTASYCPYKGKASYYSIVLPDGATHKDIVWYYTYPTHECAAVAGHVCFYNEKVDTYLDGKLLERPKTHFA